MTTASTVPARRGTPASQLTRTVRFATASTGALLRNGMFVFFTVALPAALFLMFNGLFGDQSAGDVSVGTLIMVRMAAYGGVGAAVNAGAMIQIERHNGWIRQLMVAGLTPRSFVIGKLAAAMLVVLPALGGVYIAGILFAGVRMGAPAALASLLLLWITMLPLVVLGLAIGLGLRPSAVQAASTIAMMGLAIIGGLWFPFEMFPAWLQEVARYTPTYWIGELGTWGIAGGDLPVRGVITLAVWTVVLAGTCMLLLRRAARTASRR